MRLIHPLLTLYIVSQQTSSLFYFNIKMETEISSPVFPAPSGKSCIPRRTCILLITDICVSGILRIGPLPSVNESALEENVLIEDCEESGQSDKVSCYKTANYSKIRRQRQVSRAKNQTWVPGHSVQTEGTSLSVGCPGDN